MFNLSDNYHLRKCFLKRKQIPTQTTMKKIMSAPLADVYFQSMGPKLRIMAGFEPPMKGGGKDWFIPPEDLLQGKIVMKPFKSEYMKKLNYFGVDDIATKLLNIYRDQMKAECENKLQQSDENWQARIIELRNKMWDECSANEAKANTHYIQQAFEEFSILYSVTLNKFQDILYNAAICRIKSFREETFTKMQMKYENFLKQQSLMLRDRYDKKLNDKKRKLKSLFIENTEIARTELGDKLHDIKLEKRVAVEKLRKYLECQNLACQVYVAMKERLECLQEIKVKKEKHAKQTKALDQEIALKEFEIRYAIEKKKEAHTFNKIWLQKVCHVVKRFQMFVSYCLKTIPEHADFFINMEKLMLLQLNESLNNSSVESIIEPEKEPFHTPIPLPHPFYLFCEKNEQPNLRELHQNLCPKHCTSSASQLPVIIINKQCLYAACDNFAQFTDKVTNYLHGQVNCQKEFEDIQNYADLVPVKFSSSQNLKELRLESSLLQILEREVENIQGVSFVCGGCKVPYCFYCSQTSEKSIPVAVDPKKEIKMQPSVPVLAPGNKITTRKPELVHEREPKWDQYLKYLEPKRCDCSKLTKHHLLEHLPTYMRKMSYYDAPELLNYEPCPIATLKLLVERARGIKDTVPLKKVSSKTKDIYVQCSDQEFEYLCTCFSDKDLYDFLKGLPSDDAQFRVVGGSQSASFLTKDSKSFVMERVRSLKELIQGSTDVKEIFQSKDCRFE